MDMGFGKESMSIDISCTQQPIPMMGKASTSKKIPINLVEPEITKAVDIVVDVQARPMDVLDAIPRKPGN